MAVVMKSELLTYTEAARELGVHPSYIGTLVARGKLKSVKEIGDKKKYITRENIESFKRGQTLPANPEIHHRPSLLTGQAFSAREALELVNEGFAKISGDYKDTVGPVIQHVVSTDEEAIMAQLSEMIRIFMRNALYMLKQAQESPMTAEEFFKGMFAGLDLPEKVQDRIARFLPELLRETESELTK